MGHIIKKNYFIYTYNVCVDIHVRVCKLYVYVKKGIAVKVFFYICLYAHRDVMS